MKGERREVHYNLTKQATNPKDLQRQQIAAQMAEFEKRNKVEKLANGATGIAANLQKPNSVIKKLSVGSKAGYSSRVWNDAGGKK